jgi:hypothetical protein
LCRFPLNHYGKGATYAKYRSKVTMATFNNKKLSREAMGAKPNENYKKGLSRKLAMGVPLVASASGVKGGRGANRAFGMLTGVTASKTGVKVDPLGVAMAVVPTGILGKIARKAIPASRRIAGAAARVAGRSGRVVSAAERAAANAEWEMARGVEAQNAGRAIEATPLGGNSNRYDFRGHGAFDESLGYNLSNTEHGIGIAEGERLVRQGMAEKIYSKGGDSWVYKATGGKALQAAGETQYATAAAKKRAAELVASRAAETATTKAASREIRRRLAALRGARRSR